MRVEERVYKNFLAILKEELVLAVGCTEPACLALAGARLREVLGRVPQRITIKLSANLIKNTQSVLIPYSNGLKGMREAVWLGIFGGESRLGLAALSAVPPEAVERVKAVMDLPERTKVELLDSPAKLHLIVEGSCGADCALVEIRDAHSNFVRLERNGEVLLAQAECGGDGPAPTDRSSLSVQAIVAFADQVNLEDVEPILRPQIEHNSAIAQAGLAGKYGAGVGRSLLEHCGESVGNLARAQAAAASDARMGGADLPVVINSGSGNQGIAASIPVIVYARHLGLPEERLLRALCVSNLVAIHQKTGIGRLSAYCGAVSAACGAGAGIAYLLGGNLEQISTTITNTLANVAGIICDGAKASCAAKIASSVDAAVLALNLSFQATAFPPGDGIVQSSVEETIDVVRDIAAQGMRQTDLTVLKHMIR